MSMTFATLNYIDPPVPIDSDRVVLIASDGREAFEVRAGRDGHSIEVRGIGTYKVGETVYLSGFVIHPHVTNSITISSVEWKP